MRNTRKVCIPLILLLVLLGAGPYWAIAEPVPPDLAQAAAHTFSEAEKAESAFYWSCIGISEDAVVGEMQPLLDSVTETCLAYVFKIRPVGYVVVSTDTMITPVVAYSYRSDFSWEDVEENILLQMLKLDMKYRLEAVGERLTDLQVVEENEELWEGYLSGSFTKTRGGSSTVYGPWVTTQWHQYSPYNDGCPLDPILTTNRCVVGCVATALSQILNYWQYPTSVTFTSSDSYTSQMDPGDGNGQRTIAIDATTASFSGLNYSDCNPSNAGKADLCFAAGVSVRMNYSSCLSVASTAAVGPALAGGDSPYSNPPPERWGYTSADLRSYNTSFAWWDPPYYTTETSFYDQLSANMQLARPAEMAITGTSTGGGHAIVVDGWQSSGRFYHLNYGWGSSCCGWYTLPRGMPEEYDVISFAVLNIVPTATTHSLTVSSTGNGMATKVPDQSSFTAGTHVILTATAGTGESFVSWQGDLTGSTNPTHVIMDRDKTINAVFTSTTPQFVTSVGQTVSVPEGSTTTFGVKLSQPPLVSPMQVYVWRLSGDTDVTVSGGVNLTFSVSNWNTYQAVTLAAAEDADTANGKAAILIAGTSPPNVPNTVVTATEQDNDRSGNWAIEIVDSAGDVGGSASIALDELGCPHISYHDRTNDNLKYAYQDGVGWWNTVTVDASAQVGEYTSIAVCGSGYPHISYYDGLNDDLKYAYKDPTGWNIVTVDTAGGKHTSIALDNGGSPYISYYCDLISAVKYAYKWTQWNIETVDIGLPCQTSIALDGNIPHTSYSAWDNQVGRAELRYAYRDYWTGWHIETVVTGALQSAYTSTSIAVDVNDYPSIPHISYSLVSWDLDPRAPIQAPVTYAYKDSAAWHLETVENLGTSTSIALDRNGYPHITYYAALDWASGFEVRYAYKDGSGWHVETVDRVGHEIEPLWYTTSIALDRAGNPHISYYDNTNGDLRYAYRR